VVGVVAGVVADRGGGGGVVVVVVVAIVGASGCVGTWTWVGGGGGGGGAGSCAAVEDRGRGVVAGWCRWMERLAMAPGVGVEDDAALLFDPHPASTAHKPAKTSSVPRLRAVRAATASPRETPRFRSRARAIGVLGLSSSIPRRDLAGPRITHLQPFGQLLFAWRGCRRC
jgi:hypothetical protein